MTVAAAPPAPSNVMELAPSEVRKLIMAQHDALRAHLAQVETLAREAVGGEQHFNLAHLERQAGSLIEALRQHLATEERLLLPLLAKVDAWGDVRVDRMESEHSQQRALLAQLSSGSSPDQPIELYAERVLDLIASIRIDMQEEEKDMLHPDLLRDDIVVIAQADG